MTNNVVQLRRKHTESLNRWSRSRLRALGDVAPPSDAPPRPMRRADCIEGERPCPWVSCRHHLALDVTSNGNLAIYAPATDGELDLEAMPETCALDVAGRGEQTLEEVAELFGLTRERIRQIADVALARFKRRHTFLRGDVP